MPASLRPIVLAAALVAAFGLVLPPPAAFAEEHGGGEKKEEKKDKKNEKLAPPAVGERYARLPTIALELWDKEGAYHMSTVDLILQVPEESKFSEKKISEVVRKALNVIPYEEYSRANPAPMIKSLVLDRVRQEPGCEQTKDVLISKLLFR
jgi:hypothetical protein